MSELTDQAAADETRRVHRHGGDASRPERDDPFAVGPDGLVRLQRLDRAAHAHPGAPRALLPGEYDVVRRLAEGIIASELPARRLSVDKAGRLLRKQGLSVGRKQVEKIMGDLHSGDQVARTRAKDIEVKHPVRQVIDFCVAGHSDPSASWRRVAEVLCQPINWDPVVLLSKDRRIYVALVVDPVRVGEFGTAAMADAPPKSLPLSHQWALHADDGGHGMFVAARFLLGAVEQVFEYLIPGESRRLMDELRDELAGGAPQPGDAQRPDLWRVSGSVR